MSRAKRIDTEPTTDGPGLRKPSAAETTALDDDEPYHDDGSMDLRVRVKDKDPNSVGPSVAARQSRSEKRLGKLFRDPSPALDAVKRPLSAILKRPSSKAGKRKEAQNVDEHGGDAEQVLNEQELDQIENRLITDDRKRSASSGTVTLQPYTSDVVKNFDATELDRSATPDIPTLPDTDMSVSGDVARAPHTNMMADIINESYNIDENLQKNATYTRLGDIDLSALSRFLCAESDLEEPEQPWSWDYLYTSVCNELRTSVSTTQVATGGGGAPSIFATEDTDTRIAEIAPSNKLVQSRQ